MSVPSTKAPAAERRKGNSDLTPEAIARIDRNIELCGELLKQIFDDLTILDRIPYRASVFVIPEDDPVMAASNLEGARRAKAAGQTVYVHYLRDPHGLETTAESDPSSPDRP